MREGRNQQCVMFLNRQDAKDAKLFVLVPFTAETLRTRRFLAVHPHCRGGPVWPPSLHTPKLEGARLTNRCHPERNEGSRPLRLLLTIVILSRRRRITDLRGEIVVHFCLHIG